LIGQEIKRLN